ncbi:DUF1707 SHOCT-like domain-containing protein [Aldersonia kunmingensis]|uniref:DUF1707 SHOCT-like domain-containing protein n=1 Tax=Aldersonia kunmingensis TaxID=408066 RepID=UPI000836D99A|nr:DUF1707 domain-containing protein [Aldersonia kunmingensis]
MATRLPAGTRARDEDRAHTCSTLDEALANGQLDATEHDQRVRGAMSARTLGDLHELIDDLQADSELAPVRPGMPALPGSRRSPWLSIVVLLLVIGGVLALLVRSCGGDSGGGVLGSADEQQFGPAGYLSPAGLTDIVTSIRGEFGDALVDDLTVYPEYAVIFRADPRAPRKQEVYRYDEKGFGPPSSGGTRDPKLPPVDLAAVDMAKVAGLVAGAATSLGLSEIDTIYAIIRSTETGPEVSVHANNELGESGHLSANPDGTFRSVYPFDPDR